MTPTEELCNICNNPEAPTFQAGGLYWCDGCAHAITEEHVDDPEREEP